MNWYKIAKVEFPFNLDDLWEAILSLKFEVNVPLPKPLGKLDDMEVILVNGDKIKKKYFMDFVEGGNDMAYKWIPKNEIWIDDNMSTEIMPHITYHEFIERYLMKYEDMSYDDAHDVANKYEKKRI